MNRDGRRVVFRLLIVLLGTIWLAQAIPDAAAQNPFTGGASPGESGGALLPRTLFTWVARQQAGLNDSISREIRSIADGGSWSALATVLGLSFLFGVLHAVGPGHGKFVISSYLVSRRATIARGIVMGGLISLVQGIVAILLVALLGLVLGLAQFDVLDHAAIVETISYGLILLIGGHLLYRAVRGEGHDHAHVPIAEMAGEAGSPGQHDHHEHGHAHGHDHTHRRTRADRSPVRLVLAAGLVPCASAIIVMLFALANHAFLIGAEAAIAMSLGMGVTVAGIGVLSVVARRLMVHLAGRTTDHGERVERGLGLAGSALLVLFSALLLSGALVRL
jgi:ABC-type nickel/cobalt efflux system permease component RcnA